MLKAGGGYLIGVRVRVFYTQPTVSLQIPDQRKAATVKNNNSSIGFHLLSCGSDENMP